MILSFKYLQNTLNLKPDKLGSWHFESMFISHHAPHVACHMSRVSCQVSHVRCQVSLVTQKSPTPNWEVDIPNKWLNIQFKIFFKLPTNNWGSLETVFFFKSKVKFHRNWYKRLQKSPGSRSIFFLFCKWRHLDRTVKVIVRELGTLASLWLSYNSNPG